MKRHYQQAIFWLGFGFATPSAIAESNDLPPTSELSPTNLFSAVNSALLAFEETDRSKWAFQVNRFENEEGDITQSIERYDPRLTPGKQWQLLTLNGEQPTEKQRRRFSQQKSEASKRDKAPSFRLNLRELIQMDTLRIDSGLGSDSQDHLNIRFEVSLPELGDEASSVLIGQLTLNEQEQFIERIAITNTDNFSPMFSASIEQFSLTMQFIKKQNAILPQQYELAMQGTFAYFTEINETSLDTFSEYELTEKKRLP